MDSRSLRSAAALAAAALAGAGLLLVAADDRAIGDGLSPDTPRITAAAARRRPRGSRRACPEGDRDWIVAGIAAARPEAQRLIAEVDGLVEYQVHRGDPLGVTRSRVGPGGASFVISFDVSSLDGDRRQDRAVTVLHEYGHAIDLALVPQETNDVLEAGIPRTGACGNYGGAHDRRVRRARGALRRHVRQVGAARQRLGRRGRLRGGQPALARGLGRAALRPVRQLAAPARALSACSRRPSMPPATVTIWPVTCPAARSSTGRRPSARRRRARRPCAAPSWP